MNSEAGGCKPAASIRGVSSISCSECPFPFCVMAEAEIIRLELRERLARLMRRLGNSVEETAKAMGVTPRSVYRYASVHEDGSCVQCNLIHSQDVMCRSSVYSVACKDRQHVIVLNVHRHATAQELKLVEYFVDYVFPSSVTEKRTNGHDYWLLNRVELEEAKNFRGMCDALNQYTLSLVGDARCLQQIR